MKAAEQNSAPALCKLGDYYFNGIVVKKDEEKAEDCYRRAAMKGDREAEQKLYDILFPFF